MDKKKAFELAEALESGKYKQGRGLLYHAPENSYCCLGVACNLTGKKYKNGFDGFSFALSETMKDLTGFGDSNGGLSFKFIAKILRKHYKNIK